MAPPVERFGRDSHGHGDMMMARLPLDCASHRQQLLDPGDMPRDQFPGTAQLEGMSAALEASNECPLGLQSPVDRFFDPKVASFQSPMAAYFEPVFFQPEIAAAPVAPGPAPWPAACGAAPQVSLSSSSPPAAPVLPQMPAPGTWAKMPEEHMQVPSAVEVPAPATALLVGPTPAPAPAAAAPAPEAEPAPAPARGSARPRPPGAGACPSAAAGRDRPPCPSAVYVDLSCLRERAT